MRKRIPRCHLFGTELSRLVRYHSQACLGMGHDSPGQLSRRMTAWDSLNLIVDPTCAVTFVIFMDLICVVTFVIFMGLTCVVTFVICMGQLVL